MELVIVHITDIHIKEESDKYVLVNRTNSIVGAIAEVIRNPEKTMLLICVTGDIAYSGSKEQYKFAKEFFDDIYDKIVRRYEDIDVQFIFVPGNHDCDFNDSNNIVRKTVISNTLDMSDAGTIEICTSIQKNYFEFVKEYESRKLSYTNRANSLLTSIERRNKELGDYNIKLHCINTAWCSFLHENKNMKFYMPEGIEEKKNNDIIITLMHHGDNWFDWNGAESWENYHKKFSDIILVGHDHYSQFVHKTNYDSTSNYFIKGNQLYSSEEPEQSGFNILKINLQENIEFFYSYAWNGKLYERIIDTKAQTFERNKYSRSKFELNKEIKEELEDIEIDISNKYKSPLLLSDIYVFPSLEGETVDDPDSRTVYRKEKDILDIIQDRKKILIDGSKEYGKTALLKRLVMIFYENQFFPILIKSDEIKSADEDKINKLIREKYEFSYKNLLPDEVMQMEKEKRICFIDDFDEVQLSDKTRKIFLEYINYHFDIVILTINNRMSMIATIKNLETNQFLGENFYMLKIRSLKRYGKSKIIDKWLLLENIDQDINSQEFDAKRKAKLSQMDSVLRNGYFNNTPLEFLLVLSYVDNVEMLNVDYSRYYFVYDCMIRDKINEIADKDTKIALSYKTLLEFLAYDLYSNNLSTIFQDKYLVKAIGNYNENYSPFKITYNKIIQKLVDHKILVEMNDRYKFKYSYMFYYFVGSYIVNSLSADERNAKTMDILSNLSLETNYNIALFMAYSMSTQHDILPKIKIICEDLLREYKNFKYEDQHELLEKINSNILEKLNEIYEIPDNKDIPKKQEEKEIEMDDIEEIRERKKDDKKSEDKDKQYERDVKEDKEDKEDKEFKQLLRLIDLQGDILKNFGTKIPNKPRREIIELMGNSNLKLIGYLCETTSEEIDYIIEIVDKKAKEHNEEKAPAKKILLEMIKNFISILWAEFIELNVSNLAYGWESDNLEDDILEYKEKLHSVYFDMVYIEYKMRITNSKLPVSEIKRCSFGKRKLNSFSMQIMKRIVAYYLTYYQYDSKDKEQVCNILQFDYKKLFIEDQKTKMAGMEY